MKKTIKFSNADVDVEEFFLIQLFVNNCCDYLNLDFKNMERKKTESPDFIFNKDVVGIEITRALDQNLTKADKKADSIRNKKFKNMSYCPTLFENEKDESMPGKEIEKLLEKSKNKLIGKPYVGKGLEGKVVNNIIKSIEKKLKKFKDYKKCETNILLVHAEDRASLDRTFVIDELKKYVCTKVNSKDMPFNYICLKLADRFHFFHGDKNCAYDFCVIND